MLFDVAAWVVLPLVVAAAAVWVFATHRRGGQNMRRRWIALAVAVDVWAVVATSDQHGLLAALIWFANAIALIVLARECFGFRVRGSRGGGKMFSLYRRMGIEPHPSDPVHQLAQRQPPPKRPQRPV